MMVRRSLAKDRRGSCRHSGAVEPSPCGVWMLLSFRVRRTGFCMMDKHEPCQEPSEREVTTFMHESSWLSGAGREGTKN